MMLKFMERKSNELKLKQKKFLNKNELLIKPSTDIEMIL